MGHKSCCFIVIIMLLICSQAVYAEEMNEDDFFDLLNSGIIITNVSEIEYDESDWIPDQTWQTISNTNAWIEIVGYNYSVKKDDIFYTNQSQEYAARVMYGISENIDAWNWGVSSLSGEIVDRSYDGACVTVTLETTLVYYESRLVCVNTWLGHFCHVVKTYYTDIEYFTVTDCTPPLIYPALNYSNNISVVVYNNTFAPKVIINVPQSEFISGFKVDFRNETAYYYFNTMTIDYLYSGFPYGNVTDVKSKSIFDESNIFSRIGDSIILNSNSTDESLKIYVTTPYIEQEINYSVTNFTNPSISKKNAAGLFNVVALCFMIGFIIKYLRSKS